MSVTDELLRLVTDLEEHPESDWSGGAEAQMYSAFNSGGIECETGEFLHSLIRLIKPKKVLETGTHHGVGALYMALALSENGHGSVTTVEFLKENYELANDRFKRSGLGEYIHSKLCDVKELYKDKETMYDLILLDTEPQTRFEELLEFYPSLQPGGFVFIHDLHRHMGQAGINPDHPDEPNWPWGTLPEAVKKLVQEDKLRPFHFSTPRGLTGFYKPTEEDFKWA